MADREGPASSPGDAADELRETNARLLIAGLKAQDQVDDARRDLDQLNALFESLGEAVTILNASGQVLLMNRAATNICGLAERSERVSPSILDQLDRRRPDDTPLPPEEWPVNRALRGEQFQDAELLLVRPDGVRLRLVASGSAIRDARGQVALAIVVHRDVTALRQLEQLREDYVALISHDLRTPLTAVLGQAQMAQRRLAREAEPDPEIIRRLETISAQVWRMSAMIDDLLESSRLEAGPVRLRTQPTDLAQLVADVAGRLDPAGDVSRLQVVAVGASVVSADPEQLGRVLANLVTNALKYSPPGSPVVLRVGRSAGEAIVAVTDQGVGIAPENLSRVFERFARVDTAGQPEVEGVGLGLYIARLIVEAHGGRIWAESEVGQGSTFCFALPLATSEPDPAAPAA